LALEVTRGTRAHRVIRPVGCATGSRLNCRDVFADNSRRLPFGDIGALRLWDRRTGLIGAAGIFSRRISYHRSFRLV